MQCQTYEEKIIIEKDMFLLINIYLKKQSIFVLVKNINLSLKIRKELTDLVKENVKESMKRKC